MACSKCYGEGILGINLEAPNQGVKWCECVRRGMAAAAAQQKPGQYTFVDYGDGFWRLITDDGYSADWGPR